jgi:cation transport ATPase
VLGADLGAAVDRAQALGQTPVLAGWDGEGRGVIVVADTVTAASAEVMPEDKVEVVRRLQAEGGVVASEASETA